MINKTKIEWTNYTWNPIVGCKNNCSYCYAKRLNDRFKWIPDWTKPKFYYDRLNDKMPKKPSKIFVCSMADLFGDWVEKSIIENILIVVGQNPQHTFQFLTKNPKRYLEFIFPKNCWLGITIDGTESKTEQWNKSRYLKMSGDNYKFISFEPLLGEIDKGVIKCLPEFNLVIVGAMSGTGAIKPKQEWIKSIKHRNIFYKNNIKEYIKLNI